MESSKLQPLGYSPAPQKTLVTLFQETVKNYPVKSEQDTLKLDLSCLLSN